MTTLAREDTKAFEPGTTGWTAADLDDPRFEPLWEAGRYEIIEGALVTMAAAFHYPTRALSRLIKRLVTELDARGEPSDFLNEADIVLTELRVVRPDALYLSRADLQALQERWRELGRDPEQARIVVPPTLVIENVSKGHEVQDRQVKRRWYAEAGVAHYWILDARQRSLECLVLDGRQYRPAARGQGDETISVPFPPGATVPLKELWSE